MNDTQQSSALEMLAALNIALELVKAGVLTAEELRTLIGLPVGGDA